MIHVAIGLNPNLHTEKNVFSCISVWLAALVPGGIFGDALYLFTCMSDKCMFFLPYDLVATPPDDLELCSKRFRFKFVCSYNMAFTRVFSDRIFKRLKSNILTVYFEK
jgi:hypothetical protein